MFNNHNNTYLIDKKIIDICNYEYCYFFNKKNVIRIGFSSKIQNGINTFIKCIKVFVTKKLSKNSLKYKDIIPKYYKGIPTDVVESSPSIACTLRSKVRPVTGGYSISPIIGMCGGTFGCLVSHNNIQYILSNNHVLAEGNLSPLGVSIVQPSIEYGGKFPKDKIANLSKFVIIKFKYGTNEPENTVDCAIGEVKNSSLVSNKITFLGTINSIVSPFIGQKIQKVGSTTELTLGEVTAIGVTDTIIFSNDRKALYKNQILTTKIADIGDSGAVLLDDKMNAVGLLMSGSKSDTTCNPIKDVLKELNVTII